jgi:Na+-driven multidrug efflux pump
VAFDVLLIPALGIVGAAAASLLAYSVSTIALLVAYRAETGGRMLALVPRLSDARQLAAAIGRSLGRPRRQQS